MAGLILDEEISKDENLKNVYERLLAYRNSLMEETEEEKQK